MTRFLVVGQWQGSSSSRAMQLIDGAAAIAGDLPRAATTVVEVPMEAGEALESGVRRWSSLQRTAGRQLMAAREVAAAADGERMLTLGGDAGVAVTAALAAVAGDPAAAVVWFSAHADLSDAATSPSGAFDTMAVRALVDPGVPAPADLTRASLAHLDDPGRAGAEDARVAPSRLILAGARAVEPADDAAARELGVRIVPADALTPESLAEAVAELAPSRLFVHVDLDVLDPAAISGVADAVPFGLDAPGLIAAIRAVRAVAPLSGAALTEFSPASPAAADADLGTILRVIGALT